MHLGGERYCENNENKVSTCLRAQHNDQDQHSSPYMGSLDQDTVPRQVQQTNHYAPTPPPPWLPLKKMHTTTLILVLRIAYMYMYLNGFSPGTIHCSPLLLSATFFQASLVLLCDRWYGADGLRTACRGSSTLEVMYRPISNPSKLNTNR